MDPASLYGQLGRLIETMPDLTPPGPYSADILMWLARAHALISEQHDAIDIAEIKTETEKAVKNVSDVMNPARKNSARLIASLVYRALALAELHAPANAQGAFIPAGNVFDAMAAVGKVLSGATGDLLIVDPYMDEKALTDFAPLASEKVSIRLLADQRGHKPTLRPASERWRSQYGDSRPLDVRLAPARTLHDRIIIADGSQVWILTQSLNAFAARSPASIVRSDSETAALKVSAYQATWDAATPIG